MKNFPLKIQQQLLKDICNDKGHNWNIEFPKSDAIYFGSSTFCFCLNNKDFLFSFQSLINKGCREVRCYSKCFESLENLEHLEYECTISDEKELVVLKSNKEKIYLDLKLLKNFGNVNELTFKGLKSNSPVYIYNDNILLGLLLPVFRKD